MFKQYQAVSSPRLLKAIRAVAQGDSILEPSVTAKVVAEFTHLANLASQPPAPLSSLSESEPEVLRLGAPLATNLFITEGTARNHLTMILSKLEVSGRLKIVSGKAGGRPE